MPNNIQIFFISEKDQAHCHRAVKEFVRIDGHGISSFDPPKKRSEFVHQECRASPARVHVKVGAHLPRDVTEPFEWVHVACLGGSCDTDNGDDFGPVLFPGLLKTSYPSSKSSQINAVVVIHRNIDHVFFADSK